MKEQTFTDIITKTRTEALEYIRGILKSRGTNYELVDPNDYEEEIEDSVYDLPRGTHFTKDNYLEEYPIVIINIDDENKLTFEGLSCIGETEKDYTFDEDELSVELACAIADHVYYLEN